MAAVLMSSPLEASRLASRVINSGSTRWAGGRKERGGGEREQEAVVRVTTTVCGIEVRWAFRGVQCDSWI
jgi:hypothetical protein